MIAMYFNCRPMSTRPVLVGAFLITAVLLATAAPATGQIAIRGETVYTMAGAPIQDGVVLVRDGRIERVGPASQIRIPNGYRTLEARVVTPGLIDARSVVGLAGIFNHPHDQDQLEQSAPIQPELRAIDAYNPREELVEWIRNLGVTTIHTGHGPGALISGQTMIAKTFGETLTEALVDSTTMISVTLGPSVSRNFSSPGTRAKSAAMLRAELIRAREYRERRASEDVSRRGSRDLRLETLAAVLDGRVRALVTAHQAPDILTALRLADEFGISIVLDGAAEAYLVLDEIRAAGVAVILHPTMIRTSGETANASFETASRLREAGIPFALQSGFESYVPKTRVVLFEAAITAANGQSFANALASITIDAARILGIDGRVGSLEAGKDADLVLFDGDPFEYTTRTCGVIINGVEVSSECR
jgi:imidazolonepropionase-like amidohydrolase